MDDPARRSPLRGLAAATTALLAIAAAAAAVSTVLEADRYRLVSRYQHSTTESALFAAADAFVNNEHRLDVAAIVDAVIVLATAIALLAWLRSAYTNAFRLGDRLSSSPRGAVGWWFVPIVNLVRVPRIMQELWKSTSPGVLSGNEVSWRAQPATALIPLWWGLWLLSGPLIRVSDSGGESSQALKLRAIAGISAGLVELTAALLLMALVWRITQRQSARLASVAA